MIDSCSLNSDKDNNNNNNNKSGWHNERYGNV